jgi:hypothetical protein
MAARQPATAAAVRITREERQVRILAAAKVRLVTTAAPTPTSPGAQAMNGVGSAAPSRAEVAAAKDDLVLVDRSTQAITEAVRPRVATSKPSWVTAFKPPHIPFYTTMQLQHGVFAANDVADSFASRLYDAFHGHEREAKKKSAAFDDTPTRDADDRIFFPVGRADWFSRGVTVAALNPAAGAFLSDANATGAVLRRYHLLCRVPACVTAAGIIEDELAADATRSRVHNPSIKSRISKRRVASALEEGIPTCVVRTGFITGSLLDGTLLREKGTLEAHFGTLDDETAEDALLRRVSSLFAGAQQASRAVAPGASCGENCPCHDQTALVRGGSANAQQFLTGGSTVVPKPTTARRGRRKGLDFTLIGVNAAERLALYEVSTVSASEGEIRAAFAFSGLPVVHDPDYDVAFAQQLQQRADENVDEAVAAPFFLSRKEPATRAHRLYRHMLAHESVLGTGLCCFEITFPDPELRDNHNMLLHLSAVASTTEANPLAPVRDGTRAFNCVRVTSGPTPALFRSILAGIHGESAIALAPSYSDAAGDADSVVSLLDNVHEPTTDALVMARRGAEEATEAVLTDHGGVNQLTAVAKQHPNALGRIRSILLSPSPPSMESLPRVAPTAAATTATGGGAASGAPMPKTPVCRYCFGPHALAACPRLQGRSPDLHVGDETRLFCIRCGDRGHLVDRCKMSLYARVAGAGRCLVCDEAHAAHTAATCPERKPAPEGFNADGVKLPEPRAQPRHHFHQRESRSERRPSPVSTERSHRAPSSSPRDAIGPSRGQETAPQRQRTPSPQREQYAAERSGLHAKPLRTGSGGDRRRSGNSSAGGSLFREVPDDAGSAW